uniref:Autophagy-related protein 101 n=1 Tax=Aceria tosichella TaxID=561515 RepID=A0A6G1SFL4_9ACAR
MNIRNHTIELQCNHKDVNDVTRALIHSIIFFRTHGKFNYKHEGSYSIGTLGFERAFCDRFDFNYIRCSSPSLTNRVNSKIQEFVDKVNEFTHSALITVEFFTKRPSRWPFNDLKIVWEMWNIKFSLLQPSTPNPSHTQTTPSTSPNQQNMILPSLTLTGETSHQQFNNPRAGESAIRLEELLSQKLLDIIGIVNSEKCSLPAMPTQPNLDTVFETSHSDLQPYLYNISYRVSETAPGSHSVIGTSAKFGEGGTVSAATQSSLKKFLLGTLEL